MALIGSIAINMSVRMANLVKGMKAAQKSVADFGNKAAASTASFGAAIASAGKATAGVVNDFYIKPFMKAARVIGGVGKLTGQGFMALARPTTGGLMSVTKWGGKAALSVGRLAGGAAMSGIRAIGTAVQFAAHHMKGAARFAQELGAKLTMIGAVGAFAVFKAAKAASSLTEQTNRASILFGENAKYITDQAEIMAQAFGVSKSQFIGSASEIGGMFKGAGYSAKQAAQMGAHFAKLAKDVGSATQMGDEEAMQRMMSGLSGEAEAVRRWGVDLTEANLKLKMLSMGMKATGGEFSQSEKMQARVALMTEKLAYANGDLARTADEAENAAKGLAGRWENFLAAVGKTLLPVIGPALAQIQVGIEALSAAWTKWTSGAISGQAATVGALGKSSESVGWFQNAIRKAADGWDALRIGFLKAQIAITDGLISLTGNLQKFYDLFKLLAPAIGVIGDQKFFENWNKELKTLKAGQEHDLMKKQAAPPSSVAVDKAFEDARNKILSMREQAVMPGPDVTKFVPKPELQAKAKVAGENKFASAALAGSSEATNAILKSKYGAAAGGQKPEELTAKNTAETVFLLKQLVGAGKGGLGQTQELAVMALAGNW